MACSIRQPCLIFQSEPLCENCPACRNSKPPLGSFRAKTKRLFLKTMLSYFLISYVPIFLFSYVLFVFYLLFLSFH